MPSFDIVSEVEKTEVKNAVEQTNKEVSTRFDFKGSDARVEQAELVLTVHADNIRGIRAYERAGFRRIGTRRNALVAGRLRLDEILMDAIPEDIEPSELGVRR